MLISDWSSDVCSSDLGAGMSEKLANLLSASDDAGALSGAREADAASVLPLAWERIRTGLRRDLGAKLFDQWLRAAQLGEYCDFRDRKSTRLNSSHLCASRMPSSA